MFIAEVSVNLVDDPIKESPIKSLCHSVFRGFGFLCSAWSNNDFATHVN